MTDGTETTVCDRCGREAICHTICMPDYKYRLCADCMSGAESILYSLVKCFDTDGSTVYIQLTKEQVIWLRRVFMRTGFVDHEATQLILDCDQTMKLRLMLTDPKVTDAELGISKEDYDWDRE